MGGLARSPRLLPALVPAGEHLLPQLPRPAHAHRHGLAPAVEVVPLRTPLLGRDGGGWLFHAAKARKQPIPPDSHPHRRRGADRLRLQPPARAQHRGQAGAVPQLRMAAELRQALPGHPRGHAGGGGTLVRFRVARTLPGARLPVWQAFLLQLGLWLRRARRDLRGPVAPPARGVSSSGASTGCWSSCS